jgi:hypothetical protein
MWGTVSSESAAAMQAGGPSSRARVISWLTAPALMHEVPGVQSSGFFAIFG